MAIVSDSFGYDQCMDLIKMIPASDSALDTQSDFWPIILAIFAQKANRKSFFFGRRVGPTLDDIQLILGKIGQNRDRMIEQNGGETWRQMSKVIVFLTQKSLNSAELEIENRSQLVKFELEERVGGAHLE